MGVAKMGSRKTFFATESPETLRKILKSLWALWLNSLNSPLDIKSIKSYI